MHDKYETFLISIHEKHELIEYATDDYHLTIDNTGEDIVIYIDKFGEYEQQHFVYEINDGLTMTYLFHETDDFSFVHNDLELIHENLKYYEPEIMSLMKEVGLV